MADVKPKWVIEQVMRWEHFNCCGDEDLVPLKCRQCGFIFVVCFECDSRYFDLHDPAKHHHSEAVACPGCAVQFDGDLWSDYRVTLEEWCDAGHAELLQTRSAEWFANILSQTAEIIGDLMRRGMGTTIASRLPEFRSVADAVSHAFPNSTRMRNEGRAAAERLSGFDAVRWCNELPLPIDRAYAVLGIADKVIAT